MRRIACAGNQPALRATPTQRGSCGDPGESAPVTQGPVILRKRADFLAANRGQRIAMPGFVLQLRPRGDGDDAMRVGFTVTKKIGGAVVRNRMKRRLRALARELLPERGLAGADHVLIGRSGGVEREFSLLRDELGRALDKARRC